jgi:hypothetical protein
MDPVKRIYWPLKLLVVLVTFVACDQSNTGAGTDGGVDGDGGPGTSGSQDFDTGNPELDALLKQINTSLEKESDEDLEGKVAGSFYVANSRQDQQPHLSIPSINPVVGQFSGSLRQDRPDNLCRVSRGPGIGLAANGQASFLSGEYRFHLMSDPGAGNVLISLSPDEPFGPFPSPFLLARGKRYSVRLDAAAGLEFGQRDLANSVSLEPPPAAGVADPGAAVADEEQNVVEYTMNFDEQNFFDFDLLPAVQITRFPDSISNFEQLAWSVDPAHDYQMVTVRLGVRDPVDRDRRSAFSVECHLREDRGNLQGVGNLDTLRRIAQLGQGLYRQHYVSITKTAVVQKAAFNYQVRFFDNPDARDVERFFILKQSVTGQVGDDGSSPAIGSNF